MALCGTPVVGNRRTFWTTLACAVKDDECGTECSQYGIELYCPDRTVDCSDHHVGDQRSIRTDDWVRSLAVNILLTNGRRDDKTCGYLPGQRGGHWSDSYRPKNYPGKAGSNIRYLESHGRIADALSELKAIVQYDLQKMVTYGVATTIEVSATYLGNNTAKLDIIIYGHAGELTNVGMSLQRVKNSWTWFT